MDASPLGPRIETAAARLRELRESSDATDTVQVDRLHVALEELSTALEELRVSDEELRVQNEELAAARDEAQRQGRRFQELFEFAPCGYVVTDLLGTVQQANVQAGMMLQHAPQHLQGKPLAAMIPDGDRRRFREALQTIEQQGRIDNLPISFNSYQPVVLRFLLLSARRAEDPLMRIPTIRWSMVDVTPQRMAEAKALNLDRQMWQRVAEETADLRAQVRTLEMRLAEIKPGPPRPAR